MRWTKALVLLLVGQFFTQSALADPHPFHDDGGLINWKPSLRSALDAAQRGGKPIFLEAGRKG